MVVSMKLATILGAALPTFTLSGVFSAAHAQAAASAVSGALQSVAGELVDGEVRKIGSGNTKITHRYGEIKNLEMPAMTMVFQVTDPVMLERAEAGDKIMFKAEKVGGAMVVIEIQAPRQRPHRAAAPRSDH